MAQDTARIRSDERFDQASVSEYLRIHLPDLIGDHEIVFNQFPGACDVLDAMDR